VPVRSWVLPGEEKLFRVLKIKGSNSKRRKNETREKRGGELVKGNGGSGLKKLGVMTLGVPEID